MEDFFHTADNANDRNLKNLKVFFFLLIFCEVYGPQPTRTFQETLQELRILTCHGNSNLLFNSPCLFSNIVSSFPLQCTSCPRGGGGVHTFPGHFIVHLLAHRHLLITPLVLQHVSLRSSIASVT